MCQHIRRVYSTTAERYGILTMSSYRNLKLLQHLITEKNRDEKNTSKLHRSFDFKNLFDAYVK